MVMKDEVMCMNKWIKKHMSDLTGKTIAISGATGGIGRELCFQLASLGASLVLINRSRERAQALENELREKYTGISITHIFADMAEMESVKRATDELSAMKIDYLILNAGAYSIPRYICDTGYDNVFQINFISPYYMARGLIEGIRAVGGKIVAIGSIAHNYSKIDKNDVDFRNKRQASLVYGNSKRHLTYALLDLSKGDVAIAHPGITFTGITNHYPKLIFALIKHPMKVIFMKPAKASLSVLYAMVGDSGNDEWFGPRIFDIWGLPSKKKLRTASASEIREICRRAEEIYSKCK